MLHLPSLDFSESKGGADAAPPNHGQLLIHINLWQRLSIWREFSRRRHCSMATALERLLRLCALFYNARTSSRECENGVGIVDLRIVCPSLVSLWTLRTALIHVGALGMFLSPITTLSKGTGISSIQILTARNILSG